MAASPALRAALSVGISAPRLASVLRALGPPSTVWASARSRDTLGTEAKWEALSAPPHPPGPSQPQGILSHRESLKLLRDPGSSPGVGFGKQELFTLQMRPWSQEMVPADGRGLLGKWPADRSRRAP